MANKSSSDVSKSKARKAKKVREQFAKNTPTLKVDYSHPDRNRGKKIHYGATMPVVGEEVPGSEEDTPTT